MEELLDVAAGGRARRPLGVGGKRRLLDEVDEREAQRGVRRRRDDEAVVGREDQLAVVLQEGVPAPPRDVSSGRVPRRA